MPQRDGRDTGNAAKIGDERNAVIDSLESEIIELVMEIAKKVLNVQLEKDDKIFVELIKKRLFDSSEKESLS